MRALDSAIWRYAPTKPPQNPAGLASYLEKEHSNIQTAIQTVADGQLEEQHAVPAKLKLGSWKLADGADWNPRFGQGLYYYTTEWRGLVSVGSGGTVTQATSKSTAVTLNKDSGEITLNGAALNAATIVSFTLTNSTIGASDVLILNHVSGGTIGSYALDASCAAGSATVYVRNNTAGNLSEAIVIRFTRIPGAVA